MEAYISQISPFGCNYVVKNWASCNGSTLQIRQNSSLYSIIEVIFGGDDKTTFSLPDLRSRNPIGVNTNNDANHLTLIKLGEKAGQESVSLQIANLPQYSLSFSYQTGHVGSAEAYLSVSTNPETTTSQNPDGAFLGPLSGSTRAYSETLTPTDYTMAGLINVPEQVFSLIGKTDPIGAGSPVSTLSPYLGLNYQICLLGLYPNRN